MLYDRKIKYLDYFENGERVKGGGFAKLEMREGELLLQLTVKGLHGTDSFFRDVIVIIGGKESVLGQITLKEGNGTFQYRGSLGQESPGKGKRQTEAGYEELQGIRIPISNTREVNCIWGGESGKTSGMRRPGGSQESGSVDGMRRPGGSQESGSADGMRRPGESQEPGSADGMRKPGEKQETDFQGMEVRMAEAGEMDTEGRNGQRNQTGWSDRPGLEKEDSYVQEDLPGRRDENGRTDLIGGKRSFGTGLEDGSERSVGPDLRGSKGGAVGSDLRGGRRDAVGSDLRGGRGGAVGPDLRGGRGDAIGSDLQGGRRDAARTVLRDRNKESVGTVLRNESERSARSGSRDGKERSVENGWLKEGEESRTAREAESGVSHTQARPVKLMEDKWHQLSAIYPHVQPFKDERDYLSIRPGDFVLLSSRSYQTANNSFLLHGYYNYHHLILTRIEKRDEVLYYLGVPGNYYAKEKQVAVMFGFESFESAQEPAQIGDFGYYMMRVEL